MQLTSLGKVSFQSCRSSCCMIMQDIQADWHSSLRLPTAQLKNNGENNLCSSFERSLSHEHSLWKGFTVAQAGAGDDTPSSGRLAAAGRQLLFPFQLCTSGTAASMYLWTLCPAPAPETCSKFSLFIGKAWLTDSMIIHQWPWSHWCVMMFAYCLDVTCRAGIQQTVYPHEFKFKNCCISFAPCKRLCSFIEKHHWSKTPVHPPIELENSL